MAGLRYLLDTNIIAEPIKKRPNKHVLDKLKAHQGELFSASIVLHEILFGLYRLADPDRKQYLASYLEAVIQPTISFLPYDHHSAAWHARERARLEIIGLSPSFADGQIASIAHTNSLVIVTRNTKDFKNFKETTVENWFG